MTLTSDRYNNKSTSAEFPHIFVKFEQELYSNDFDNLLFLY